MASSVKDHFVVRKTDHIENKPSTSTITPSQANEDNWSKKDQEYDGDEQSVLRQFDLDWQYGPCIGLTRLERWERADKHGLSPPRQILDLINKYPQDSKYTQCVWNDYTTLK